MARTRTVAVRCVTALVALAAAAPAWAHGGNYVYKPRERTGPPPTEPEGGRRDGEATTGGGAREPATTAGSEGALGADDWHDWWGAHRWGLFPSRAPADETPSAAQDATRTRTVAALVLATSDPDDDVATAALVALGRMREASAEPLLVAALGDARRTQTVRESAACALALLGTSAAAERSRIALESVVVDRALPGRLRAIAVYALGLRGAAESYDVLSGPPFLATTDGDVAAACASSLGLLGTDAAVATLEGLVAPPASGAAARPALVRVYAAHGLALAGRPASVAALRKAFADPEPAVRRGALLAAGVLGTRADGDLARALRKCVDTDRDASCRDAAVLSLGRQGHPSARAVLDDALAGGRGVHPTFAATALGLWARTTGDTTAVAPLRTALMTTDAPRVASACAALGLARDRQAAAILLRFAEPGGEPRVRSVALAVLPALATREDAGPVLRRLLGGTEPPDVRREAATALGVLGDPAASAELADLVARGDSLYVRAAATVALGRVGGRQAPDRLLATLESKEGEPLLRALAAVGLGILHDRPRPRGLGVVFTDLDWRSPTDAVIELSTIL